MPCLEAASQLGMMNVGWPRQSGSASAVAALLLVLLALTRALVPSGYMLDRAGDDGRLVVHMCSGSSARSMVVDLKTGGISNESDSQNTSGPSGTGKSSTSDLPCPFALSAVANQPTASTLVAPTIDGDLQTIRQLPVTQPIAWLSRPPLPGRGPPGMTRSV